MMISSSRLGCYGMIVDMVEVEITAEAANCMPGVETGKEDRGDVAAGRDKD